MIRETSSWMRAWLGQYWAGAGSLAAAICLLAYLETGSAPFCAAGVTTWLTALCSPRGCLHGPWLRLPPVKWHLHRKWVRNVRVTAAIQRDVRRTAFCWGEALADIDPVARADFVHDLTKLDHEMTRAAAPKPKRKEQQ